MFRIVQGIARLAGVSLLLWFVVGCGDFLTGPHYHCHRRVRYFTVPSTIFTLANDTVTASHGTATDSIVDRICE